MAKAKADLRSEERAPAVQRDASVPQGDTYRDTGADTHTHAYTHKVREKKRREETGRQRDRHKSQSGRTQRTG
jgi:hypothetical protein